MAEMKRRGLSMMGPKVPDVKKPEVKMPTSEGDSGNVEGAEEHTTTITHHADGTHSMSSHGEDSEHPDHLHMLAQLEPVTSASFGLEEAAVFASSRGGGLVALTPAWFGAAGLSHSAGLTFLHTLKGFADVTVLDYSGNSNTTTPATSYYAAPISAPVTGGYGLLLE